MTSPERQRLIAELQQEERDAASAPAYSEEQQAKMKALLDALNERVLASCNPRREKGPPTVLERTALQAVYGSLLVDHVKRSGVSLDVPGVTAEMLLDALASSYPVPDER